MPRLTHAIQPLLSLILSGILACGATWHSHLPGACPGHCVAAACGADVDSAGCCATAKDADRSISRDCAVSHECSLERTRLIEPASLGEPSDTPSRTRCPSGVTSSAKTGRVAGRGGQSQEGDCGICRVLSQVAERPALVAVPEWVAVTSDLRITYEAELLAGGTLPPPARGPPEQG